MNTLTSVVLSFGIVLSSLSLAQADDMSGQGMSSSTMTMKSSTMTMKMAAPQAMKNVGGPLARELRDRPVLVMIHADWCSACKQVKPVLQPLVMSYGKRLHVVMLDVTDAKTAAQAEKTAQRLGLARFFAGARTATSTVAVINPRNGAVTGEFYDDIDGADYTRAIQVAEKQLAHK